MKIKNTPEIINKLEKYLEIARLNAAMEQVLIEGNNGFTSEEIDKINSYAKSFQQQASIQGDFYTQDEVLIAGIVSYLYQKVGAWDYIDSRVMGPMIKKAQVYSADFLAGNPYIKAIKVPVGTVVGECQFVGIAYDSYELFSYDEAVVVEPFLVIPKLSIATGAFQVPALLKRGEIISGITPQVAFAMEKYIKAAVGKVLIIGDGLGYLAYRLAQKEVVETITIVEQDKDVFSFLKRYILPQFGEARGKINLVFADGSNYVKKLKDGDFDYCLVDMWSNSKNSLAYLQMKQVMRHFKKTPVAFCLEDSMLEGLLGYVFILMCQGLDRKIAEFANLTNVGHNVFDYLSKVLANVAINSPEDVDYYLNKQNLARFLAE